MTRARFAIAAVVAVGSLGCDGPDTFVPSAEFGGPAGVLAGGLTYAGPRPCTRDGRIVGAAVVLGFDVRLLPPPDGLGTTAQSLDVISGERLFSGIRGGLGFAPDGALLCPDATDTVLVSADWALSPLAGGVYQVRGFYDRDGDFDPTFSISNLPTLGDVAGGAIDNAPQALLGAAPRFREIALGDPTPDGGRVVPETGARVSGISVALGLPLELERPVFWPKEVLDASGKNTDPQRVTLASDFQLATFDAASPAATEKSFVRIRLGAGVPPAELDAAAAPPFGLPVKDPPASLFFTRQDVNGDGKLDAADHVPDSDQLPSLFPLAAFLQLDDASPPAVRRTPTVFMQGITLYKSLPATALSPPDLAELQPEVMVALRPAALCLDPLRAGNPAVLVVSHPDDSEGNPILADEAAVKEALGKQLGRAVEIAYGCLPEGRYTMNLVYASSQAWTLPNEAAVCSPLEEPSADGALCGTRPRLASQGAVLTVGPPGDAAYCAAHPTPPACRPSP